MNRDASARALVAIGVVGMLAAGCVAHPGAPVAERLGTANLPYIDAINYYPAQLVPIDGERTDVIALYFLAGATDAEVQDVYCNIVTPAAAAELGQRGFYMYRGVRWDPDYPSYAPSGTLHRGYSGGEHLAAPTCPE